MAGLTAQADAPLREASGLMARGALSLVTDVGANENAVLDGQTFWSLTRLPMRTPESRSQPVPMMRSAPMTTPSRTRVQCQMRMPARLRTAGSTAAVRWSGERPWWPPVPGVGHGRRAADAPAIAGTCVKPGIRVALRQGAICGTLRTTAPVAQRIEQRFPKPRAACSSQARGAFFMDCLRQRRWVLETAPTEIDFSIC